MNAKEYLENNHWPESHAFSRDDVANLMESYHKAKSKEEADKRYEDAIGYMDKVMGGNTRFLQKSNDWMKAILIASGKEES